MPAFVPVLCPPYVGTVSHCQADTEDGKPSTVVAKLLPWRAVRSHRSSVAKLLGKAQLWEFGHSLYSCTTQGSSPGTTHVVTSWCVQQYKNCAQTRAVGVFRCVPQRLQCEGDDR